MDEILDAEGEGVSLEVSPKDGGVFIDFRSDSGDAVMWLEPHEADRFCQALSDAAREARLTPRHD